MDNCFIFNESECINVTNSFGVGYFRRNRSKYVCYNSRRCGKKKPNVVLSGEVEADECYVVAGHKGQPHNVIKAGRQPRRRRLKGKRGRGTSADEKNPIFGIVQRGGLVSLKVLPNVQQITIQPIIESCVEKGSDRRAHV